MWTLRWAYDYFLIGFHLISSNVRLLWTLNCLASQAQTPQPDTELKQFDQYSTATNEAVDGVSVQQQQEEERARLAAAKAVDQDDDDENSSGGSEEDARKEALKVGFIIIVLLI